MQPTAALPKVLYNTTDESTDITEHPLLELLSRPNPLMYGSMLWEATLLNLLLPTTTTPGGQCFWVLESGTKGTLFNMRSARDIPKEIWPFSDNVIKPRIKDEQLVGWQMEIAGRVIQRFELDEIIRIHLLNPDSLVQGLSPYSAAMTPVLQDIKSDEFNSSIFDNAGALGGLLTTDNDDIDIKELKEFAQWFDSNYKGVGAAGRTVALSYGLKYEQMIRSNQDMQYMEMRKDNRKRIQAAYGVSDEELGIYESGMNRATAEQADRSVWQKTRLPLDKRICAALNAQWIRFLHPGTLRIRSDTSTVEALQPYYTEKLDNAVKLAKDLMVPPAEIFRQLNIPIDTNKYPWLEKVFVPMHLVDISLLAEGAVIPQAGGGGGGKPPNKSVQLLIEALMRKVEKAAPVVKPIVNEDSLREAVAAEQEETRAALWAAYAKAVLDPGEKIWKKKLEAQFLAERNEMLDNVDDWSKSNKKDYVRELVVNPKVFLFDLSKSQTRILKEFTPEARRQMERELRKMKSDYGDAIEWNVTEPKVAQFVKRRAKKLKELKTLRFRRAKKAIVKTVKVGMENNWTPQELAKELKETINDQVKTTMGQALVVARTEIGSISGMSRFDAFKESGIEKHEWLSARDYDVVRLSPYNHQIDGQTRRVGEPFSNGLKYPLDPTGAPGNVINCRCTTMPKL
jgi:HK97 family phage portal protein